MLQYDFTESVFLMKILQGRGLLGRDIPIGLSDPYAIISIIPAWRGQRSQRSRIINGKIAIDNCEVKSELEVTGGYATVAQTRLVFCPKISPLSTFSLIVRVCAIVVEIADLLKRSLSCTCANSYCNSQALMCSRELVALLVLVNR